MILDQLTSLEKESLSRRIPIVGREKGFWIYQKILELKPQKILELGTANGYSGIILGSQGAELTTIEINPQLALEAKDNFKKFNINSNILTGDAVRLIKTFKDEQFDFIFIDFAKHKYLPVLKDALRVVKKKGCLLADNITMAGCQAYKEAIMKDSRLKTEIISIKDGMAFSQKL